MACSLTGCSGSSGNKVPPLVKTNGSERDKPIVVQTGHNPFNSIRPKGVCLSPCSALDRTSKDDPKRSGLAVRASQCTSGYNKNSDVRGWNVPQTSREGGIDRNPLPSGMGRFKSIRLEFIEGSSCKEYRLSIEASGENYDVLAAWGRIGSTLQSGSKASGVTLATAQKIYDKIVKEKTAKGYIADNAQEAGESNSGSNPSGIGSNVVRNIDQRDTGLHPQLLVPITEDEAEIYITDDRYGGQKKYDGKRLTIKKNGSTVIAANKKGLSVGFPDAIADAVRQSASSFVVDGEAIGDHLYAFDLLELDGTDFRPLPYTQRFSQLLSLFGETEADKVVVAKTAIGTFFKRKLMAELKAAHGEGIVFKLLDAPWSAGRPAKGGPAFKCKLYKTVSVIVLKINAKRSVEVGVTDGDDIVPVGNVTISPNKDVPPVNSFIEVRYLYAYKGGSLYQPTYLQDRTDELDKSDCSISQLIYKAEEED